MASMTNAEASPVSQLLKANGVGPKLALAILSGMSASQVVSAIEREDISSLIKLPGVGKKTAERLVVEMKDRLKGWSEGALFTPVTLMPCRWAWPMARRCRVLKKKLSPP